MLGEHKVKEMPPAPRFRDLIGPSFILLGLGLGSGELILWPHLTSNYGMGIIWAAILGVTLQFFMNMEIERYALVRGESIFVGFARLSKFLPIWFIFSTLIPWIWPGIIASSAVVLGSLLGIENTSLFAIILLVLVGAILTLGPVLYKTQESFQKIILLFGTPFILILSFVVAGGTDWQALAGGIVGKGDGYWFLPAGISLASFLAAIAYSGAGGNLNLAQSFYVKEKGFGMGKYSGRITSILTGKAEDIEITGTRFTTEPIHLKRFREWWRLINIEHGIVFWLMGTLTIVFLAFLAFSSVFGQGGANDISFLLKESVILGERTFPVVGKVFLALAGVMLFSTQLGVMDTTSRILTENLTLTSSRFFPARTIRRNFYIFLWIQILLGILVISLGFSQPLGLLILAAVLNAGAMFVHIGLTLWLNMTRLEKVLRPNIFRVSVMIFAFLFFGYFAFRTIMSY
jgi:hypothetical protein